MSKMKYTAGYVAFKDREADWGEVIEQAKRTIAKAKGEP